MARRARLLVVDDKPNFLALFRRIAGSEVDVVTASDAAEALALLGQEPIDVVVSDVKMPGASGLELLAHVKNRYPSVEVILMTAFADVPDAVRAIKAGAFHYLTKPFDPDAAMRLIREALAKRASGQDASVDRRHEPAMIASSLSMQATLDVIGRTGPLDVTVLISGESGTGKELVARAIHARNSRRAGPFIAISCGALPDGLIEAELFGVAAGSLVGAGSGRHGLFQQASGGTLFLDDVAELPLPLQAKLLRALQEHAVRRVGGTAEEPVDVRILAATRGDLELLVGEGRFREDLFYRLKVVSIRLPPLRERRDDIAALAGMFLARAASARGAAVTLSAEVRTVLEAYDWPGNVRQLENAMAHAAAVTIEDAIGVGALPDEIRRVSDVSTPVDLATLPYKEILAHSRDRSSKEYFVALLKAVQGNVTQAAERAGIERESLHRLLKRYGLRAEDFRSR